MKPTVCFFLRRVANLLEQGPLNQPGGLLVLRAAGVRGQEGEDREGAGTLQGLGAGVWGGP